MNIDFSFERLREWLLLFDFSVEWLLLFGGILFLTSILTTKAGTRFGIPVLLLFLLVGMIFGVIYHFNNYDLTQAIGTVALCIILFSGGLDTSYNEIKPVIMQGAVLATLGVLLKALITGIFIYFIVNNLFPRFSLSFLESLLLASVMSSTDSASVFAILRGKGVRLRNNLKPMLELESGSNDPMAYMLTMVLIQLILSDTPDASSYANAALSFVMQFIIGTGAGYLLGKATVWLMNKINLENDSFYSVLLFTCGILIFSGTHFIQGNGFLAVYIAGLIIGNRKVTHKRAAMKVFDGLTWISQLILFLTLGLLINPKELLDVVGISLLIGAAMIVFARPLSVIISLLPFHKMGIRDKIFVSWVGLKGAVPILFAIMPMVKGIPSAHFIFNVVFFITILSLLTQGTSLTKFADLLHLSYTEEEETRFHDFDVEFAEEIKATMLEFEVSGEALKNGNCLKNLPIPENTLVILIKRNGQYIIPNGNTLIMEEDKLLVITSSIRLLLKTFQSMGVIEYRLKKV
jgi:cell volume regulation protein A